MHLLLERAHADHQERDTILRCNIYRQRTSSYNNSGCMCMILRRSTISSSMAITSGSNVTSSGCGCGSAARRDCAALRSAARSACAAEGEMRSKQTETLWAGRHTQYTYRNDDQEIMLSKSIGDKTPCAALRSAARSSCHCAAEGEIQSKPHGIIYRQPDTRKYFTNTAYNIWRLFTNVVCTKKYGLKILLRFSKPVT